MKRSVLLVVATILCSVATMAQMPVDEETGKFKYQEVVKTDGTQQEFFVRAVAWVNSNYKNAASVTSVRDPHTGVIEGNHRIQVRFESGDGTVKNGDMILYHFKLQFKDGRYRYTFDEFFVKRQSRRALEELTDKESDFYRVDNMYIQESINERISELIESLKENMAPVEEEEEEEW